MTDAHSPLIVHVIHHLVIGGMENGLVNLINRLPVSEYRHAVLCVEDYSAFRHRIRRPDVEVIALRRSRNGVWRLRRTLYEHFRRMQPSIVHTRGLSGLDAVLPARLAGVRAVVHGEHGWDVDNLYGRRWKARLLRRIHSPLIDRYVAVSADLQRFLVDDMRIRADRVSLICNGVDTEKFSPGEPVDLGWLPESFRASGLLRLGTVGRIQAVKDQATLVLAMARASVIDSKQAASLRLVIVGDGPLMGSLRERVRAHQLEDRVHLAGSRDDVPNVLRSLQLFALPSLNEGMSNTLLEAMATGLPAVVTAVGGNPELLPNGVAGMHFRPGDVDALARLLLDYARDPDRRLAHGAAARKRVLAHYSLDTMVAGYRGVYDLVKGSSP